MKEGQKKMMTRKMITAAAVGATIVGFGGAMAVHESRLWGFDTWMGDEKAKQEYHALTGEIAEARFFHSIETIAAERRKIRTRTITAGRRCIKLARKHGYETKPCRMKF